MNPWFWILVGLVACPFLILALACAAFGVFYAAVWLNWKVRKIRCRREWTHENPYWPEAFEAGAKWAREGEPRDKPNLARLRMPGKEKA